MLLGILAAPAAADQSHRLIVSGNGDASDDPSYPISTHAFATGTSSSLVNPSTPDAVYTSGDGFAFQYGTFPPSKAGLLWFDVSSVPQGRRIVRATLHLKTW